MEIWKPTQAQCDLIKRAAVLEPSPRAALGQIKLSPGVRLNRVDDARPLHMNIARVSSLHDWHDTDVHDRDSWASFRKGVELCPEGSAIIDFYIHARTQSIADKLEYLLGNVVVFYKAGELTAIRSIGHRGQDYLPRLLENQRSCK